MATIIAHRVFSELVTIAQSNVGALERRTRMSQRMDQFKRDIARSEHQDATKGSILTNLRAVLELAANSPALSPDRRSVLAEALDTLSESSKEEGKAPSERG